MPHYNFRLERTNRSQEHTAIEQRIDQLLDLYNINPALHNMSIIQAWQQITGDLVKQKTERIFVKNKKIFLRLSSPALKSEMLMQKTKIIAQINEFMAKESVEDIILF